LGLTLVGERYGADQAAVSASSACRDRTISATVTVVVSVEPD
jgi:hypothetical protein